MNRIYFFNICLTFSKLLLRLYLLLKAGRVHNFNFCFNLYSITVPDCTVVIDSGKFNMKSFDPTHDLHTLEPQWIASSNIIQRRGRAGRTKPGKCYQMYTKLRKSLFDKYPVPEMQRSSLEQCILTHKILKKGEVSDYFENAIHPPTAEAVKASLKILREVGALDNKDDVTSLGYLLANLPADVYIGKLLLYGVIFSCLSPILSIAASLSFRNPFKTVIGKTGNDLLKRKMLQLSRGTQSDLLLTAFVLKEWDHLYPNLDWERAHGYANGNFLYVRALHMMTDLKYQFVMCLKNLGFMKVLNPECYTYNCNKDNIALIRALICAAFYPNIAKPCDSEYPSRTVTYDRDSLLKAITKNKDNATVFPKSVNALASHIKTGWLTYQMKMKSRKLYLHNTTAVHPSAFFLFGDVQKKRHENETQHLLADSWVKVIGSAEEIESIMALRKQLNEVLERKFSSPSVIIWKANEVSSETKVLQNVVSFLSEQE